MSLTTRTDKLAALALFNITAESGDRHCVGLYVWRPEHGERP